MLICIKTGLKLKALLLWAIGDLCPNETSLVKQITITKYLNNEFSNFTLTSFN